MASQAVCSCIPLIQTSPSLVHLFRGSNQSNPNKTVFSGAFSVHLLGEVRMSRTPIRSLFLLLAQSNYDETALSAVFLDCVQVLRRSNE